MKQPGDVFTLDLIDKPRRGRPRKPDALSDAQRAREYRARKRAALEAYKKTARTECEELDAPGRVDQTFWGLRGGWIQSARA